MKQKLHSTAIGRICRYRHISAKLEYAIGAIRRVTKLLEVIQGARRVLRPYFCKRRKAALK